MLCKKKGHPAPSPPCSSPLHQHHLSVHLCPLFHLLANPLLVLQSHTDIHVTQWDSITGTTSTATFRLRLLSVEDHWSGHFPGILTASIFLLFCSLMSNVVCLFFNMWGRGAILMILVVLFFLFQSWEGRCVKTTYPHLGALKHTTRRPVHRPSLSVSHTPPLPSLLPRLSPFVCTVWTIVLVNSYYSTPPSPPSW